MTSNPLAIISNDLQLAADKLKKGGLVAFPTETVYGLGADATNAAAVAKVFEAKQRPTFDPLIVHVATQRQAEGLVCEFPDLARRLADAFWPGPLTLVLPRNQKIPDLVTSGLPGVGLRMPAHPLALQLLQLAGCPIAAPSANPFGRISPTTARHVSDCLGDRIDLIVDGGPCAVGLESTVVSLMNEVPLLLRHGGVSAEEIQKITGRLEFAAADPTRDDAAQAAPGMLSRHYAPTKPLFLVPFDAVASPQPAARCGLLSEPSRCYSGQFDRIEWLVPDGDLRTCAANFFASLRALDAADLDVIIAHQFPDAGLGRALNDRLSRAAAGSQWSQNQPE